MVYMVYTTHRTHATRARMMRRFKDSTQWFFDGHRYVNELVYQGMLYAVSPGIPSAWHKEVTAFLKTHAYTSEEGIDWSVRLVALRDHEGVHRGAVFEMDPWLYDMVYPTFHQHHTTPCRSYPTKPHSSFDGTHSTPTDSTPFDPKCSLTSSTCTTWHT